VDLDERDGDTQQGIAQRDTGMGERGGIDEDEVMTLAPCLVDPIHQFMLGIGLQMAELVTGRGGAGLQLLNDGRKRLRAVMGRFPGTEQIQIRAIENQDMRHAKNQCVRKILKTAA
jgi:hypothetical protein